jgi:hypothetical protein
MLKLFFFAVSIFTIQDGNSTQSIPDSMEGIPISKQICDSNARLTHFFSYNEGDKIDFAYQPLGLLRTTSSDPSDAPSLELLKMLAAKICADGIINISHSILEDPTLSIDSIDRKDKISKKIAPTKNPVYSYTGLAVRLQNTVPGIRIDQDFLKKYNRYINNKNLKTKSPAPCEECDAKRGSKGLIFAGAGIALLFGIIVLISK